MAVNVATKSSEKNVTTKSLEKLIDCKQIPSWRKLLRVTAYVLLFIKKLKAKFTAGNDQENCDETNDCSITPQALDESEILWILEAQRELHAKYKKGEYSNLSPFIDTDSVIRVGGRIDTNIVSYKMKHPALLPKKHWISLLITRYMHQRRHNGVATTAAKTRVKYWIQRVHDLAKLVKFKCVTCREMAKKVENQL